MKTYHWDLDTLFPSTELQNNRQIVETKIKEWEELPREFSSASLLKALSDIEEIKEKSHRILLYGSFHFYRNVHDEEAIAVKEEAEKLNSDVEKVIASIEEWITKQGDSVLKISDKNPLFEQYRFYLQRLFRKQQHLSSFALDNIEASNTRKRQSLATYNREITQADYGTIEIDGKPIPLKASNIDRYISSGDRSTRVAAYEAVNRATSDNPILSDTLRQILICREEVSHLEQYANPLEKSLFEDNISPQMVYSVVAAYRRFLPLIERYYRAKMQYLEIADPHLYDLGVSIEESIHLSLTEALSVIENALSLLGTDYQKELRAFLDKGHLEGSPDDQKHQTIIFSWDDYSFLNFRDNYYSVKNLAHELGHALNYALSQNLPFLYRDSTVFTGEIAALVNEILVNDYLFEHSLKEEEKLYYLSKNIEHFVIYGYKQSLYTEFELFLTDHCHDENFEELAKQYYGKLLEEYYQGVVSDSLGFLEWKRNGHFYRSSFYPFRYASAVLLAHIVVSSIKNHSLTVEEYLDFLKSGSVTDNISLLKMLHIDLTDSHILETGFENIQKEIDAFEKQLKIIRKKEK